MNEIQKLDLKVAFRDKARAMEEIYFCTLHPQLTGPHRREKAIETYSEVCVKILELLE